MKMRKLFRFKYEPCNGTCYAPEDIFYKELRALPETERVSLVSALVSAHDKLCDNAAYSFGMDADEDKGIFSAHFRSPDQTDVFVSQSFPECVNAVTLAILSSKIPPSVGACNYGSVGAEDLGAEILGKVQGIVSNLQKL